MKHSLRSRTATELSKSLQQQLNTYALAAAATGVGLLALAPPAEAKIIYTPANVQIGKPFSLDLNHDGIVDFSLFHLYTNSVDGNNLSVCQAPASESGGCSSLNQNAARSVAGKGTHFGAALRSGSTVQAGDRFRNAIHLRLGGVCCWTETATRWSGPWVHGGKGVKNRYLGLRFEIKGRSHFGWARISITTSSHDFTATLTGYAYETVPGKAIIAGKTKGSNELDTAFEQTNSASLGAPVMLGMLALGAPSLSIWRRNEFAEPSPKP